MVRRKTLDIEILLCVLSFQNIILDLTFYSVSFTFILLCDRNPMDIGVLFYVLPRSYCCLFCFLVLPLPVVVLSDEDSDLDILVCICRQFMIMFFLNKIVALFMPNMVSEVCRSYKKIII